MNLFELNISYAKYWTNLASKYYCNCVRATKRLKFAQLDCC